MSSVLDAVRIAVVEDVAETRGVPSPAAAARRLAGFTMQAQCHPNWCWAAVTASVVAFFTPATSWVQCRVANADLGRTDCCNYPCNAPRVPAAVNSQSMLGSALNRVSCLDWTASGAATRDLIAAELSAQRPVCARTEWQGGGGHFAAIVGYDPASDKLHIEDPFWGTSETDFATFCEAYSVNHGRWTDTYVTVRPAPARPSGK
jgi:papain like cysteine protease AvrRpt2